MRPAPTPADPPKTLLLRPPEGPLRGTVALERSKSLSNRALAIRSLCPEPFPIEGLSRADDTRILAQLLEHNSETYDCGHGGTTLRFLAALLAFRPGTQWLTGSERLRERPIAPLVEALRRLGADIRYAEKEGFPPLRIGPPRPMPTSAAALSVDASVSSQFVSALLMVAPTLPGGLHLKLTGPVASAPYIRMTVGLMRHFGAGVRQVGRDLFVAPGPYRPTPLEIEADWSGASYFFALAALFEGSELHLPGLRADSLQGDSVVRSLAAPFGAETRWSADGPVVLGRGGSRPDFFRHDFSDCPDLAQTMVALCAATGTPGRFAGLGTLSAKETDRTAALQRELAKFGYGFAPARGSKAVWQGRQVSPPPTGPVTVDTYGDHRMALSMALMCRTTDGILVQHPSVTNKSFPGFWHALEGLGFAMEAVF